MASCGNFSKEDYDALDIMVGILRDPKSSIEEKIDAITVVQDDVHDELFAEEKQDLLEQTRLIKIRDVLDGTSKITLTDDEKTLQRLQVEKHAFNIAGIKRKIEAIYNDDKIADAEKQNQVDELLDAIENEKAKQLKLKSGKKQMVIMDGNAYLVIYGQQFIRAIDTTTNETILSLARKDIDDTSWKTREVAIKQKLSDTITKNFDSGKYGKLTLPQRIVQSIRKMSPTISEDGKVAKIRNFFKVKEADQLSLFSKVNKPFTSINPDGDTSAAYTNLVNSIPKHIRDIINGISTERDEDGNLVPTNSAIELAQNIPFMIKVMNDLVVPTEQVINRNYGINEDGTFGLQNLSSKYKDPNYLELLGSYVEKTENGVNYYELQLDPAIEEIIKFYSVKAITDIEELSVKLGTSSVQDISADFGISIDEAQEMQHVYLNDKAVPASSVISSSAKDAFKQIGMIVNPNIDIKIKTGLEASIDALIRGTLINDANTRDYVQNRSATFDIEAAKAEAKAQIIEENPGDTQAKRDQNKIKIGQRYKDIEMYANTTFGNKTFMFLQLNEEAFVMTEKDMNTPTYNLNATTETGLDTKQFSFKNNMIKAMNKMQYIAEPSDRFPPSREPDTEPNSFMIGTKYEIAEENLQFIKDQNAIEWSFKSDLKEFLDLYENKDTRDYALQMAGYVFMDNRQHTDEKNRLISINDKIIRDIDTLGNYYESFGTDAFYLPWGQTKGARPTLITDLNPQESKLIRSFIQQDGHKSTLSKKDFAKNSENNDALQMMEVAIAQALDLDPDKNSALSTMINVRKLVNIHGRKGEIFTFGEFDLEMNEFIATGFASVVKQLVTDTNEKGDKLTDKERGDLFNEVYNDSEGNHGTQSVRALKRLYDWKKNGMKGEFTNDLTLETDAITSGMMLTLMQIMDNASIEFLAKGGIYTEQTKKEWSNYVQEILFLKYSRNDVSIKKSDIVFDPGSLIEAGNYHAQMMDRYSDIPEPTAKEKTKSLDKVYSGEPFNDLYKTVGVSMTDTVNEQKIVLNERLENQMNQIAIAEEKLNEANTDPEETENIERSLDFIRLQKRKTRMAVALLDSIGNIDAKTLRGIAKFPVMYYIYGATVKSIKKNLTNSVGKEQLVKDIKTYHKYNQVKEAIEAGAELTEDQMADYNKLGEKSAVANEFIFSILDTYVNTKKGDFNNQLEFYKYDNENKRYKLTTEDMAEMSLSEKLMYLDISPDMIDVIQSAVDDTFGSAIEKSFQKNFPMVDEYRETIKGVELMTFELFNAALETKMRIAMEKGYMTTSEFNKVMLGLKEAELGHDSPTMDKNGKTTSRQPMLKRDPSGSADRASVVYKFGTTDDKGNGFSDEHAKNYQYRVSAGMETNKFIANTGASGTSTIHQEDGRAIVNSIGGEAWLSIYDAIVQASHPSNVEKSTGLYNGTVITGSAERNIAQDNMRKLSFMMDSLNTRIKEGDKDAQIEMRMIEDRFARVGEEIYDYTDGWQTWKDSRTKQLTESEVKALRPETLVPGKVNANGEISFTASKRLLMDQVTYNVGNKKIEKESYYSIPQKIKGTDKFHPKKITKHVIRTTEDGVTTTEERYWVAYSPNAEQRANNIEGHGTEISISFTTNDEEDAVRVDEKGIPVKFKSKVVGILKKGEHLTDVIKERENFTGLKASQSGSDLQNDMKRTGLPLEVMIERISSLNDRMNNRIKNFDQKIYSGHSWVPFVGLTEVDTPLNGLSFNPNDVKSVVINLKSMFRDGRTKEFDYLMQEYRKLYSEVKKIDSKKAALIAKDALKINFANEKIGKNNGSIEIIADGEYNLKGNVGSYTESTPRAERSSTRNYQDIAKSITRSNNIGFTSDSVVVLSANGQSSKERTRRNPIVNGELKGGYKSIDSAIAAGSTFIADTDFYLNSNKGFLSKLDRMGYGTTTDANEIRKFTGKPMVDKDGKYRTDIFGEILYHEGIYNVGEVQLRNYLLQNGYTYSTETDSNGRQFGVYNPISPEFKNIEEFVNKRGC